MRRLKGILSVVLCLTVVLSLSDISAVAEDESVCTQTEGCELQEGHEGDCLTMSSEEEIQEGKVVNTPDGDLKEKDEAASEDEKLQSEKSSLKTEELKQTDGDDEGLKQKSADGYTEWATTNSLPTSGTYKLMDNVTLNTTFSEYPTVTGSLTLDLNGHTVTVGGNGQYAYFVNKENAKLIIEDTASGGKITNDGVEGSKVLIQVNKGSLDLKGGELENTSSNGSALFVNSGSHAEISGGTITNTVKNGRAVMVNSGSSVLLTGGMIRNSVDGGQAIYLNGEAAFDMTGGTVDSQSTYSSNAAIYANNTAASIEISGGTISSKSMGIYAAFTPVTITGGTIDTDGYAFQTRNTTVAPEDGKEVVVSSGKGIFYTFSDSNNKIEGGDFEAPIIVKEYTETLENQELTITGGTFSGGIKEDNLSEYITDGKITNIENGDIIVTDATEQTDSSVARVNGIYYGDLSNAFEAAGAEGTVELVADATLDERIIIEDGETITLDLGEFSVTPSDSFRFGGQNLFTNRGTFTVKGQGTIEATGEVFPNMAIENEGGILNITSGTITANWNAIRNLRNGSTIISGGKISNIASGNQDSAIYTGTGTVEISGNAEISGKNTAVRSYGGEVSVNGAAYLSGNFGIMLFNYPAENNSEAAHARLIMTGGTIEAANGFALSGNNTMSAQCSAEMTGGTLKSTKEATAIYWPMEGTLTVGGNAVVEGGTGIEAKMGTITVKDNAAIIGTGPFLDEEPYPGGAQAEGSAILTSAQMYGANKGQYIDSPNLTVNITGGTLTGTQGNAVTVYNTEDVEDQLVNVSVTGGKLNAADGKAGVQVTMASGSNQKELKEENGSASFVTTQSKTTVTVSADAALAAVDQNGKTLFYTDVNDALAANTENAAPVDIYVLGDSQINAEGLESEKVKLTTAEGVELKVSSNVDGMIVKETVNLDGSTTYELVDAAQLAAPNVSVKADHEKVHIGQTITLTAEASHSDQDVTYSYEWYKDGKLIKGQEGNTLTVTESGKYSVIVTAHKQEAGGSMLHAAADSQSLSCTIEDHTFGEWTVTKNPTATEPGSRERSCIVCGYTVTEAIEATGQTGTTESQTDKKDNRKTGDGKTKSPETGEYNHLGLYVLLLVISGSAIVGTEIVRKKRSGR